MPQQQTINALIDNLLTDSTPGAESLVVSSAKEKLTTAIDIYGEHVATLKALEFRAQFASKLYDMEDYKSEIEEVKQQLKLGNVTLHDHYHELQKLITAGQKGRPVDARELETLLEISAAAHELEQQDALQEETIILSQREVSLVDEKQRVNVKGILAEETQGEWSRIVQEKGIRANQVKDQGIAQLTQDRTRELWTEKGIGALLAELSPEGEPELKKIEALQREVEKKLYIVESHIDVCHLALASPPEKTAAVSTMPQLAQYYQTRDALIQERQRLAGRKQLLEIERIEFAGMKSPPIFKSFKLIPGKIGAPLNQANKQLMEAQTAYLQEKDPEKQKTLGAAWMLAYLSQKEAQLDYDLALREQETFEKITPKLSKAMQSHVKQLHQCAVDYHVASHNQADAQQHLLAATFLRKSRRKQVGLFKFKDEQLSALKKQEAYWKAQIKHAKKAMKNAQMSFKAERKAIVKTNPVVLGHIVEEVARDLDRAVKETLSHQAFHPLVLQRDSKRDLPLALKRCLVEVEKGVVDSSVTAHKEAYQHALQRLNESIEQRTALKSLLTDKSVRQLLKKAQQPMPVDITKGHVVRWDFEWLTPPVEKYHEIYARLERLKKAFIDVHAILQSVLDESLDLPLIGIQKEFNKTKLALEQAMKDFDAIGRNDIFQLVDRTNANVWDKFYPREFLEETFKEREDNLGPQEASPPEVKNHIKHMTQVTADYAVAKRTQKDAWWHLDLIETLIKVNAETYKHDSKGRKVSGGHLDWQKAYWTKRLNRAVAAMDQAEGALVVERAAVDKLNQQGLNAGKAPISKLAVERAVKAGLKDAIIEAEWYQAKADTRRQQEHFPTEFVRNKALSDTFMLAEKELEDAHRAFLNDKSQWPHLEEVKQRHAQCLLGVKDELLKRFVGWKTPTELMRLPAVDLGANEVVQVPERMVPHVKRMSEIVAQCVLLSEQIEQVVQTINQKKDGNTKGGFFTKKDSPDLQAQKQQLKGLTSDLLREKTLLALVQKDIDGLNEKEDVPLLRSQIERVVVEGVRVSALSLPEDVAEEMDTEMDEPPDEPFNPDRYQW
ncbi:MAG: hypothetical protein NTW08_08345 [Gammaproteobacteria bacterium]|nr:hypothetical protein [Gammaproteobacteria bacterium]